MYFLSDVLLAAFAEMNATIAVDYHLPGKTSDALFNGVLAACIFAEALL